MFTQTPTSSLLYVFPLFATTLSLAHTDVWCADDPLLGTADSES